MTGRFEKEETMPQTIEFNFTIGTLRYWIKKYVRDNIFGIVVMALALFIVHLPHIANYVISNDTLVAMNGNLANDRINIGRIGGYLIESFLLLDKFEPRFLTFVAVCLLAISAIIWGSLLEGFYREGIHSTSVGG